MRSKKDSHALDAPLVDRSLVCLHDDPRAPLRKVGHQKSVESSSNISPVKQEAEKARINERLKDHCVLG